MRVSARARSLRSRSARPLPLSKAFASTPQEIAARLGRGARSGIGIATFAQGGVVLDGGPRRGRLPQLVSRLPFPADMARASDLRCRARAGSPGRARRPPSTRFPTFRRARPTNFTGGSRRARCRRLRRSDFATFCDAGRPFASRHGRLFRAAARRPLCQRQASAQALDWLRGQGVTGLGQSSWGPTGFAFVGSEAEGAGAARGLRAEIRASGAQLRAGARPQRRREIETSQRNS